MNNKKLGIVGGMGPMATSMFFERIVQRTVASKDQDHIDMVILNHATMPDRTAAILSGNYDDFLSQMKSDLETLEKIGVDHIAIPCNTSHFFMDYMLKMTHVPIINMVEETAVEILKRYGLNSKAGILATNGTIHTGTYERACQLHGINFVKPDQTEQDQVMKIIYDIKSGKEVDLNLFNTIVMKMVQEEHCDCVILACTELSLIPLSPQIKTYAIDAMDVLIEKSILYSGKQVKVEV